MAEVEDSGNKLIDCDEETLHFFFPLSSRDAVTRAQALDAIVKNFDSWFDGYGSPTIVNHNDVSGIKPNIHKQLPTLVKNLYRLSVTCPFDDVRDRCKSILEDLQDRGVELPGFDWLGPSYFVSLQEIVPVDTEDEETRSLFVDAFLQNNRLEHLVQVMGYHPKYLDYFLRTQHHLLRGDGPLPYEYRHYIAIMASGRHQCAYLVRLHCTEFLLQGGDENWLMGMERIPQKLRDLYELNKLMAHRPWLIKRSHIEKLTRGNDNWSLSELMHAIVLLAHFHSLSSFIYGCGIQMEVDHHSKNCSEPAHVVEDGNIDDHTPINNSNNHSTSPNSFKDDGNGMIEQLMERMKKLNEETTTETSQEEMLKRFERVESQSAELPAAAKKPSPQEDILRFVTDADFAYQDFARRGAMSEIPTFRAQDYSWEDQGYSLANRLYTDIGTLLDDKFQIAYNLTYNTMGDNLNVDTSAFRRGIWNYIHCMFGIRHDDYDYGEVNQLLERSLKSYIKSVTCYPERITSKDYNNFMSEFKHSEKVHVNLMLLEARLQAELLYALRAINNYMT